MTEPADLLTRREALGRVSALLGGAAIVGQGAWLAGCAGVRHADRATLFTAEEVALLDEIAETILPATDTPGAKAAGVGPFIAMMVTDVYSPQQQRVFRDGLREIDRECRAQHGADFIAASAAQRHALLERLDREQLIPGPPGSPLSLSSFRMLKELTLLGYFTSEIGCTQALRYVETPGRFEPCVPYAPGEKAWAPHA